MRIAVKLLGACCVMASALLAGLALEQRLRCRWQLMREMRDVLAFLEKEMTHRRTPMEEAFRRAAADCHTRLGQVLTRAAKEVEARGGRPFAAIWREAVDGCLADGGLTEEELRELYDVPAALSNADTVMQQTCMERCRQRFEELAGEEAEIFREKSGLCRRLAAAAGIFLVLLLL